MKNIAYVTITEVLSCVILISCAHQVKFIKPPQYSSTSYVGDAVTKVNEFDALLKQCSKASEAMAEEYNRLSSASWHWDFWTAAASLTGEAVAGGFLIAGRDNEAGVISAGTGIALVLAIGLKTASQISSRIPEKNAEFEKINAAVNFAKRSFEDLEQRLKSTDQVEYQDAIKELEMILVFLRGSCPVE